MPGKLQVYGELRGFIGEIRLVGKHQGFAARTLGRSIRN
jgi:hypothetical protein